MVGFARISRVLIIVATMPLVSHDRCSRWVATLHLDDRLDFNEGDIGLAGGIQMREPANANLTTADSIRRFGGSTSPAMPWPKEEGEGDDAETNTGPHRKSPPKDRKGADQLSRQEKGRLFSSRKWQGIRSREWLA